MISRAVPRSHRRQAATAPLHAVGCPVATGGGTVLTSMSQPRAQRCVHDPVPGSSLDRFLSRPGEIDPQNVRFRWLVLEGVWWPALAHRGPASVIPHMIPVRRFLNRGPYTPQPAARRSQGLRLCSGTFARRRSRRRRRAIAAASASSRRYSRKCSGWAAIQTSGSSDSRSASFEDRAI